MPIAQLSIFGWLILGPVASSDALIQSSYHTSLLQEGEPSVRDLLERFWIQEELPSDISSQLNFEEQECEDHFKTTHTRDAIGRYIVRIPLKSPASLLGNSYNAARACLKRTLIKFNRDDGYRKLYGEFMSEYEHLNHMVRAPSISSHNNSIFYLPHHGVLKPDSKTTKLRVVFNGSCATSSGYSLNDLMHTDVTFCSTFQTCCCGFGSTGSFLLQTSQKCIDKSEFTKTIKISNAYCGWTRKEKKYHSGSRQSLTAPRLHRFWLFEHCFNWWRTKGTAFHWLYPP